MAIVRSQQIREGAQVVPAPGVRRALAAWDERLRAAHARGWAEAETADAERIAAAEAAVVAAEERCEKRIAAERQACAERWESAVTALEAASARIDELQQRFLAEAEQDVVGLALAVAARVLRHEVEADPGWMIELVHQVQEQLPGRRSPTISLHPDDAQRLRQELGNATPSGRSLPSIVADAGLRPGACVVESGGTLLDAGVVTSWERLASQLLAAAPREAPSVADAEEVAAADAAVSDAAPPADGGSPA